jgi:ATP-dependent helicase/nuclease subunit B
VAERGAPKVYSIAAHRGFADALAAGLLPRYRDEEFGLARLTLLLPSSRAMRTMSEAFVRLAGKEGVPGLLLPRMVAVGDLDLDETLGPLLDPMGTVTAIPPAADPTRRMFRLAQMIREERGEKAPRGASLLRLARQAGETIDRLMVEEVAPGELLGDKVAGLVDELAEHWRGSLHLFARLHLKWLAELEKVGELDAAERRNRLFGHAAQRWREDPPAMPIVAAGVTSAAPALARLLRVVSELPEGAVILPDFDLTLDDAVWDELGLAGAPGDSGETFARGDALTHPQYHLKLLLGRMGVNRHEVQPWHRAGEAASRSERSHAISALFLPPEASRSWVGMKADQRRLSGVRIMESANPEEEAQAIALLVREALAQPEKRVAVITPDRGLASRVAAHLKRWNIDADDSAGRALPQTPAGRVLLLLAQVLAEHAAPVPLIALLTHPLVAAWDGRERAAWLEQARKLDKLLRGPRPAPGLAPVRERIAEKATDEAALSAWWNGVEEMLGPVMALSDAEGVPLAEMLDALAASGEALCGTGLWSNEDGRALSAFVEDFRGRASEADIRFDALDLPHILRDAMDREAVRPPWGGHPRIAIYGLLEARMNRAELVICGGLNEGVWPAHPAPDPLLPPPVLRALGVPAAEFRIGLAAHDLAGALGAPEVVLSRARREADGAAIPSRFLLRVQALLGELYTADASPYREERMPALARALDHAQRAPAYPRPRPMPGAEQRRLRIAVTALDRLRGDPFQFYAREILGLKALDPLDADADAKWRGTAAHDVLKAWHEQGGDIEDVAQAVLSQHNPHPLMRALWQPRLLAALQWIAQQIAAEPEREVASVERWGKMEVDGVEIFGRADRIDRLADGTLAIIDYKTGGPPSGRMVEEGFALQLGLIGMMAARGGVEGLAAAEPAKFEYWSLGRSDRSETGFGYVSSPVLEGRKKTGLPLEDFLPETERYLRDAISRWIEGSEPFTARANPDLEVYTDYDQLMRLDEWFPLLTDGGSDE